MKKSLIALWAAASILACICEPSGDLGPWIIHELACLTSAAIAVCVWNRTEETSHSKGGE